MTNKQKRALRRERARERQQRRAVQKTVAVNMASVRSQDYRQARERQDRFVVDDTRVWYVIRTLPRWATRAAEQIRLTGTPVFEAREAVNLVSEIGKRRVSLIPVLRRLIFVGVGNWQELRKVESHPGVYDDTTYYGRSGTVRSPSGGLMVIPAVELQDFADCITGHGGDETVARAVMFSIGEAVNVIDGPFANYPATVEHVDERTGRLRVDVPIFGRPTSVEVDRAQVEAA